MDNLDFESIKNGNRRMIMDAVFLLQNRIPSFINSRLCSKIENMPSFINSRIFKGSFWGFNANNKCKFLQGNNGPLFQLLFETLKSRKKKFAVHNEFTFPTFQFKSCKDQLNSLFYLQESAVNFGTYFW